MPAFEFLHFLHRTFFILDVILTESLLKPHWVNPKPFVKCVFIILIYSFLIHCEILPRFEYNK